MKISQSDTKAHFLNKVITSYLYSEYLLVSYIELYTIQIRACLRLYYINNN